jgi:hypothetical protein
MGMLWGNVMGKFSRKNQHNSQICALCWFFLLRLIMHGTNIKLLWGNVMEKRYGECYR